MSVARRLGAAALLLASLGAASAQKFAGEDPLVASARSPAQAVAAGELAPVEITLKIAKGWHLYTHDFVGTGTPIELVLDAAPGLALETVQWPAPTVARHDDVLDEDLRLLAGTLSFDAQLRVAPDHAAGKVSAVLRLTSQACNDSECLLTNERELPVSFEVRAAASAAQAPGPKSGSIKPGLGGNPEPLTARLTGPAEPVPAGGVVRGEITLIVTPPWHAYAHDFKGTGTPLDLALDAEPGLVLESVDWPAPTVVRVEPLTGEELRLLEGVVKLPFALRVDAGRAPGPARATLRLGYQTCTNSACLPPAESALSLDFNVRALAAGESLPASFTAAPSSGAPPTGAPVGAASTNLQDDFTKALRDGAVGRFLWLCVALAFVSLLTPCVFPMIPITVSFFAKRGESAGGRGVSYALAYGAGIVVTYTGFGVGMAALLGASSLQGVATNPWVNLAIGALFVFFGLSLMGLYDLRPPAFLARRAESGVAAEGGYPAVLLMGFVFTVTAFTCTAPIVGTLLAALTAGGSLPLIVLGMLVYSLAFALPFVLLALFPGALARLPGAGGWMITVKAVMGFVELVAALKFLSAADRVWDLQLMPRPTMLLMATLLMAALALYLFGAFRLPHDVPSPRRAVSARTFVALLTLGVTLYFSRGLTGRMLDSWTESFLPSVRYAAGEGSAPRELIAWGEDLQAAKIAAAAQKRPVFIDFTGVTCQNCIKVEKSIFSQQRFADAVAQKVVPVRLYTDRRSPPEVKEKDAANALLMQKLGSVTLPLYVLMSPEGKVLKSTGYDPSYDVQTFVDFLELR